jgi:hypothetical protein
LNALPSKLKQFQESLSSTTFSSSKAPIETGAGAIDLQRDTLGFKKLIILATESGIIEAFETLSGRRVWSTKVEMGVPTSLFVARTTVVKYPPVLTVVSKSGQV